ncbi:MAG: M56 family metallopeptidase [Planctomycetes bacterium]|nr:M56 family metallopeptidase [Planctomycetota bacterium]
MNTLIAWLVADPWLQVLLQIVLLVSVFAAAALALVRFDRGPSARRHALALVGLGAIALTPVLVPLARMAGTGVALFGRPDAAATPSEPIRGPAAERDDPGTPVPTINQSEQTEGGAALVAGRAPLAPPALEFAGPPFGAWIALAWLLAASTWTLRRFAFARRVQRQVAQLPLADQELQAAATTIAQSLGLAAAPPIHLADHACPATIGCRRPRLLLPTDVVTAFAPASTHAILRHELAHIALGHHRQATLQALLLAWFGWHPFVRRLSHTLDRLHEDLADNAVVTPGSATEALTFAKTLLALAERVTTPRPATTLSILGGSPFRRRIERLLDGTTEAMIHIDTKGRLFAAAATAAALLLPFSLQLLPAQAAPDPAADPRSAATWVPLLPGHRLTWRVTDKNGGPDYERESVVWGEVPLDDKRSCVQVFEATTVSGLAEVSYWLADVTGLWKFANTYIGMRGVNPNGPQRLIPGPIGSETRWEWDEFLPYQTSTLDGQQPKVHHEPKVHHVGELLAMSENVTVPAGTFVAMHIRTTTTGSYESVIDQWFAPGVGLVRRVSSGPAQQQLTEELLRYTIGTPPATDHTTALKNALGIQRSEPMQWLALEAAGLHLRGRFAVVRPRAGTPSCWFGTDRAQAIGADDLPGWQQIWAAFAAGEPKFTIAVPENRRALHFSAEAPALALAMLAAQVECARRNLRIVRSANAETTSGGRDAKITATHTVVAKDLGDVDRELAVGIELKAGQLTAVKITSDVPAPAEQDVPPQQAGPQPGQIRDR